MFLTGTYAVFRMARLFYRKKVSKQRFIRRMSAQAMTMFNCFTVGTNFPVERCAAAQLARLKINVLSNRKKDDSGFYLFAQLFFICVHVQ